VNCDALVAKGRLRQTGTMNTTQAIRNKRLAANPTQSSNRHVVQVKASADRVNNIQPAM